MRARARRRQPPGDGMSERLLVVGARPDSLGAQVASAAEDAQMEVITFGLFNERYPLDIARCTMGEMVTALNVADPTHIVCTAGINVPEGNDMDPSEWYQEHFLVNVVGPMRLLEAWAVGRKREHANLPGHYVAISSNSAVIPRSKSAAYCASKAALSMALRVKAREALGGDKGYIVYGYEPGLLAGTPMTQKTEDDFPGVPLHRMRGEALAQGVRASHLAAQIVAGLLVPGASLNGATIRYDGGEI